MWLCVTLLKAVSRCVQARRDVADWYVKAPSGPYFDQSDGYAEHPLGGSWE